MQYIVIMLLSAFISTSISADEVDQRKVVTCQHIVDQLEHIKDLKRKGGSSQYKNSLRKQRQSLDKKYGQLQCYRIKEYLER